MFIQRCVPISLHLGRLEHACGFCLLLSIIRQANVFLYYGWQNIYSHQQRVDVLLPCHALQPFPLVRCIHRRQSSMIYCYYMTYKCYTYIHMYITIYFSSSILIYALQFPFIFSFKFLYFVFCTGGICTASRHNFQIEQYLKMVRYAYD